MNEANPILVNIITSLPGILIAATVSYYFSQRKYTFEKLHDKKLSYLEELFGEIVSIEKDLKRYVLTTGSMIGENFLEQRKNELKPIQERFFRFQEYFWKKEIILNESSVRSIRSFIDTSIEMLSKLQTSNVSLQINNADSSYKLWNDAYETMKSKLEEAKEKLKKDFRIIIES
jgi:hypothetical protein